MPETHKGPAAPRIPVARFFERLRESTAGFREFAESMRMPASVRSLAQGIDRLGSRFSSITENGLGVRRKPGCDPAFRWAPMRPWSPPTAYTHLQGMVTGPRKILEQGEEFANTIKREIRENIVLRAYLASVGAPAIPEEDREKAIEQAILYCPLYRGKTKKLKGLAGSSDEDVNQLRKCAMLAAARRLEDLPMHDGRLHRTLSSAFELETRSCARGIAQTEEVRAVEAVIEARELLSARDRQDPLELAVLAEIRDRMNKLAREVADSDPGVAANLEYFGDPTRASRSSIAERHGISVGVLRSSEGRTRARLRRAIGDW